MAPIEKIVQHKTYIAIVDKNKVFAEPLKKESVATMEKYGYITEKPPRWLHSQSKEPHRKSLLDVHRKTSIRRAKIAHLNRIFTRRNRRKPSRTRRQSWNEIKILSRHKRHNPHSKARYTGTENDLSVDRHEKSRRSCEKHFSVICWVDHCFKQELDCGTWDIPSCR